MTLKALDLVHLERDTAGEHCDVICIGLRNETLFGGVEADAWARICLQVDLIGKGNLGCKVPHHEGLVAGVSFGNVGCGDKPASIRTEVHIHHLTKCFGVFRDGAS